MKKLKNETKARNIMIFIFLLSSSYSSDSPNIMTTRRLKSHFKESLVTPFIRFSRTLELTAFLNIYLIINAVLVDLGGNEFIV